MLYLELTKFYFLLSSNQVVNVVMVISSVTTAAVSDSRMSVMVFVIVSIHVRMKGGAVSHLNNSRSNSITDYSLTHSLTHSVTHSRHCDKGGCHQENVSVKCIPP